MHPSTLITLFSLLCLGAPAIHAIEMVCLVNAERAKHGLKPLAVDSRLNKAAETQSSYQADTGRMSHTGAGGNSASDRVKNAGLKWTSVAENVAEGYSEEQVMNAWMTSPGHKANILGRDYTMFGYSKVSKGGKPYYTQTFASDGSTPKNIPSCDGSKSTAPASSPASGKGSDKSSNRESDKSSNKESDPSSSKGSSDGHDRSNHGSRSPSSGGPQQHGKHGKQEKHGKQGRRGKQGKHGKGNKRH